MPKVCLMCGDSFPDTTTFCPKDGSALRAAVHGDDLIGELIAERYLITDLLSQGGMGAVYLASDVRLPQKFAVKVLRQQQTSDPSVIQRFRQEAEAVCRINHDRVARVFDFGFMPDDRAYIVMEYVAGRTLKQLVEERGALDPAEAAKITLMAAEGIDAAHRLGIVHRDLKPENIMTLDDPGGGLRVKVLDFGIAKLENAEAGQGGYTQPGFVIGTPAWMSPEQLTGAPLDARSDIYSLALVSFSLFTGERAFSGDSEQSEMLARISVPPRTLADSAPQVAWPQELQSLFDRALSREASQRPATTVQFASALVDAVNHWKEQSGARSAAPRVAPSTATPPTPAKRVTPALTPAAVPAAVAPSSRKTVLMSVVGVTVVGAIALAVVLSKSNDAGTLAAADTSAAVAIVPPPVPPAPDTVAKAADSANVVASNSGAVTPPPVAPPAGAGRSGGGVAKPPATNAGNAASTVKPTDPPSSTVPAALKRDAELDRVIEAFDKEEGPKIARETIDKIQAMQSRLTGVDRAWAQIYLGTAYYSLGDKSRACEAYIRAFNLAGDSKQVRDDSEEKRMMIGCRP